MVGRCATRSQKNWWEGLTEMTMDRRLWRRLVLEVTLGCSSEEEEDEEMVVSVNKFVYLVSLVRDWSGLGCHERKVLKNFMALVMKSGLRSKGKLNKLFQRPDIIKTIKISRLRWFGYVMSCLLYTSVI